MNLDHIKILIDNGLEVEQYQLVFLALRGFIKEGSIGIHDEYVTGVLNKIYHQTFVQEDWTLSNIDNIIYYIDFLKEYPEFKLNDQELKQELLKANIRLTIATLTERNEILLATSIFQKITDYFDSQESTLY